MLPFPIVMYIKFTQFHTIFSVYTVYIVYIDSTAHTVFASPSVVTNLTSASKHNMAVLLSGLLSKMLHGWMDGVISQRRKNLGGRVALPPRKFLRVNLEIALGSLQTLWKISR